MEVRARVLLLLVVSAAVVHLLATLTQHHTRHQHAVVCALVGRDQEEDLSVSTSAISGPLPGGEADTRSA
uniref:Putative secreted peptide n=1 Tax=Anopheles braziliensis TaxID=58242 RepID=A0A2M3ZQB8_9DIPT